MYLIKKSAGPSTHELGLTIVTNEYCDEHYKALSES